jgi:hypothetical protein
MITSPFPSGPRWPCRSSLRCTEHCTDRRAPAVHARRARSGRTGSVRGHRALEVATAGPYLDVVLPSLPATDVADLPSGVLAPLAGSVTRNDVTVEFAMWCADVVEAGSPETWLLTPLLRFLGRDGKGDDGREQLQQCAGVAG